MDISQYLCSALYLTLVTNVTEVPASAGPGWPMGQRTLVDKSSAWVCFIGTGWLVYACVYAS